jgi:hypothetical protein
MKKLLLVLLFLSVVLSACGIAPSALPTVTNTEMPTITETPGITETATPLPTATMTLSPTPSYPLEGYGPANFPADVDPLTGLKVANPALLQRRPMVIKIPNIPRNVRPQWGLSLADIVFEYYCEEGATRLAAIFYGNDASMVAPIRSGRFIDVDIVRGYKAIFAFGYAYAAEWDRFVNSEFVNRLVVESPGTPLTRYDPNGLAYLMVNTTDLTAYATKKGFNGVQNLNNIFFNLAAPAGGNPGTQAYVRYSGVIYNRWDYDASTGKYLRFSDNTDDYNGNNEQYAQLADRLTNQPIAFDNVVVLVVNHKVYSTDSNGTPIYDIKLVGSGDAYAFRNGQVYQVKWQRKDPDVVSLTNVDGTPFAFKPGPTWFEVIGLQSIVKQTDQSWRFTHKMP